MSKNFLEVNCPKCGNRNTIIPPHKCLGWESPVPVEDSWERAFDSFLSKHRGVSITDMPNEVAGFIRETLDRQKAVDAAKLESMKIDRYWVGQVFDENEKTTYGETQMQSYNQALTDAIAALQAP